MGARALEGSKGGIQEFTVNICGEASPIIECEIGGAAMKCLIDTGSKVSLLKESALNDVLPDWRTRFRSVEQRTSLVGITGDRLEIVTCCEVPLKLGERIVTATFFVCTERARLPVAGLIGQNILSEEKVDLLLSRGAINLGGIDIPILNWAGGNKKAGGRDDWHSCDGAPIRLTKESLLPPLSECVLVGEVTCELARGQLGVAESGPLEVSGVAGAYGLVRATETGKVPVRVVNTTRQEIKLPRNKLIGVLRPAVVAERPAEETVCRRVDEVDLFSRFDLSHVAEPDKSRLRELISEFGPAFSTSGTDIGHCEVIKHRVSTGDAAPVYRRAYRIPYSKRDEMERQVNELLDAEIIEHSTSPWGAPALLVEKPDGSYRFVVDYRDLNRVTRIDPYPLPNILETLSELGSARFFTVVDMASGYWQIEMHEHDKEKTAFNTPSGHYQWRRMPMGLVNSAAVWQRTADVILAGLLGKVCHVYLDDIIVYSSSFEDHLNDLRNVFQRVRAAGLKLKPSKCQFLRPEVRYLGHIVSAEGVRPDPSKIQCVQEFPEPRTKTEVRQFLGLLSYYRRHIPQFAEQARPLTQLTTKKPFSWGEEEQAAFSAMKRKLTEAPLLKFPDFSRPFTLATDASKVAVGAVLSQEFDGKEHPVAYASRQLNPAEQKYGATEQECLAVVWSVRHFRCFLYGRHFKIVTDCQPLKWLMNARDPSSRLARWNLLLQEYDYEVIHRAGKTNQNADTLSRMPVRALDIFVPSVEEARMKREQFDDPGVQKIVKSLKAGDGEGQYYVDDGGLLRFREKAGGGTGRLVVPASMKGELLRVHHDAPYAGHSGARKTRQRIGMTYFWPGMRRDVLDYCRKCPSCALHKTPKNRKRAPLQVFEELSAPFQRTAMDIVGPLPTTTAGNKYILVFVDHLSRYAEAFPLADQKAETVARVFVEGVVLRHGVPEQLLTDQGTNFVSRVMKEVYDLLGIKKLQTTAYHPECNGAVERLNQTLVTMLSHYVAHDQRDWDRWLPFAVHAYNTAVHEGTNETPFFLLHGRDAAIPSIVGETPRMHYNTMEDYRAELAQRLSVSHKLAYEALNKAAEKRKSRLDKRSQDAGFQIGDRVYVKVESQARGLAKKLAPKWKGPFRVVEKLSDVTCRIRGIRMKDEKIVNVNKLKIALGEVEDELRLPRVSVGTGRPRPSSPERSSPATSPFTDALHGAMLDEIIQNSQPPAVNSLPQPTHSYALRSRGAAPYHI